MSNSESLSRLSKKAYDIAPLKEDGSNYNSWKFRQQLVLRLRRIEGIVTGQEKRPTLPPGADAKTRQLYDEELADWQARDQEAFAQITLAMEDGVLADVIEAETAHEAWTRIVARWEGSGVQSLSFLYHQLVNTKLEEEQDVSAGFNLIRSTASKMKTLGEPVGDSMLAQILMNVLPPSYAIVSTVLQTSNSQGSISPDMVVRAALAEEERRKKGLGLTAMFSNPSSNIPQSKNSRGKGKQTPNPKPKGQPCANCDKIGHTKDKCWAKGGGAEGCGPFQKRRTAKGKEKGSNSKAETGQTSATSAHNAELANTSLYALPVVDEQTAAHFWLLDSGASRHMTPQRSWFSTYRPVIPPIPVRVGDGSNIQAVGIGQIMVTLKNRKGTELPASIKEVLHVPDLNASLMSVNQLTQGCTNVIFQKDVGAVLISDNGKGKEVGWAKQVGQLYKLQARITHTDPKAHTAYVEPQSHNEQDDFNAQEFIAYTASTVARANLPTWHRRLGHLSYQYVLDMVRKGAVEGMDIIGSHRPPSDKCGACIQGKQTRAPFTASDSKSSEVLELLHSDLHGPTAVQAIGGVNYFAVTIDDKSRKLFVHLLRHKSEFPAWFKELKASIENLTGHRIKHLRTDGGGEYTSNDFQTFLRAEGIQHQMTEADSSPSNGVAEHAIRTLNDQQQAMRIDANLPDKYWGYAILHAAHLWNVTPKKRLNGQTPNEVFSGKTPNISGLRTFGCKAWARVPDKLRTKLQARSLECIYLGFALNRKAHILANRVTGRILTSRDVIFDEGAGNHQ